MSQSKELTQGEKTKTKQPLWKLIVLIASLTIIGAIIITIIVFACVKVNLMPNINVNAPYGMEISQIHGNNGNYAVNSDEYLTIVNKLKKGFTTNYLNSFTQGVNGDNKYSIVRNNSSKSLSSIKSDSDTIYTLHFMFSEDQKIYNADGTVFKSSSDVEQTYREYVIVLTNSNNGFNAVEMWFFSGSNDYTYINLTAYGNFRELIDYLDLLKERA